MSAAIAQRRYLTGFDSRRIPNLFTDVLILGGGVAGLRAALAVAAESRDVIVATKDVLHLSATAWAQGGIAAAVAPDDCPADHARDTSAVGCGLCDEQAVRLVVDQAPRAIDELQQWGARLDHVGDALALGREGGHTTARIVHAMGDATGGEIARVLAEKMRGCASVRVFERCMAIDLVTLDGRVAGAITFHPRFGHQLIWAAVTILATGGAGCVYRETTNPAIATGDGPAIALRAGATLRDMEMVQFHPTTLYIAGAARTLITEAARGDGAYLCDRSGRRFMLDIDPRGELASRDVVSRGIMRHIRDTREPCVYLDLRHLPPGRVAARFPGLSRVLGEFGLDPARELIPVRPAAHYMVGGVRVDLDAQSSLPGLLACGEAASSGLHGANRLASNSLLEGLVFGRIAGETALGQCAAARQRHMRFELRHDPPRPNRGMLNLADIQSSVRSLMDRFVGIERTGDELAAAVERLDFWASYVLDGTFDDPAAWETQNLITVAWLIAASAAQRRESRGVHFRGDFPGCDERECIHVDVRRTGDTVSWTRVSHCQPVSPQ